MRPLADIEFARALRALFARGIAAAGSNGGLFR